MTTTPSNIWMKLAKAQVDMKQPVFDCVNKHFGNKYASLKAVTDAVMPSLLKHGLFLSQNPVGNDDGTILFIVTNVHDAETTESVTLASYPIQLLGRNDQQVCSAITYARRYSLTSAFCRVADEDDDGNGASLTERDLVKDKLFSAIDAYSEQRGLDRRAVAEDALNGKPLKEWSVAELRELAEQFESEVV